MYIKNGIAYAGEEKPMLKVNGVRPLENHRLWLRFNTGEAKVFDLTPLLSQPAFAPLADINVFQDPIYCKAAPHSYSNSLSAVLPP